MNEDDLKTNLSPLMYSLYHLNVDSLPLFNKQYYEMLDSEEIKSIINVIEWIDENPSHDLRQYLMPLPRQRKLSNEQIKHFLQYIYHGLIDNNIYKSKGHSNLS